MSLLDRIAGLIVGQRSTAPGQTRDENGFYFYIRCGKCGETMKIRADRRWDFQQEFEEGRDEASGYSLHKEVMGQRCFQMIRATLHFDARRNETKREIRGGEFVTSQEYEASTAAGQT